MFLALALVGAAISLYLTYLRPLVLAGAEGGALCTVGGQLDCRPVLASPYASVGGVPLSVVALWFYIVTAAVAVLGMRRRRLQLPRSPAVALFLLYAVAMVISVILGIVSAAVIAAVCPLCVSLYLVNAVGLTVALYAVRCTGEPIVQAVARERIHWAARPRFALWFAALAVVPLPLLAGIVSLSARPLDMCTLAAAARSRAKPFELEVFSDFQCRHCRALHATLKPVRADPRVRIHLRHYPLDTECNPRVRRDRRTGACVQARAAICANAAGRSLEYDARLFDGGPNDIHGVVGLAESLGLDRSRFAACLGSEATAQVLRDDVAAAIAREVTGTPTVFLNGQRLAHTPTAEDVHCLVADGPPGHAE